MKEIDTLWGNIFRKKPVLQALKETSVFSDLTTKELSLVEEFVHLRNYEPGESIFNEGDPGVGMYIVVSGKITIIKKTEKGPWIELATIEENGFFGEISIIEGGPRTASAKAAERTDLLGFFKSDLEALMEKRPAIATKILYDIARIVCERLRITNEELSRCKNI